MDTKKFVIDFKKIYGVESSYYLYTLLMCSSEIRKKIIKIIFECNFNLHYDDQKKLSEIKIVHNKIFKILRIKSKILRNNKLNSFFKKNKQLFAESEFELFTTAELNLFKVFEEENTEEINYSNFSKYFTYWSLKPNKNLCTIPNILFYLYCNRVDLIYAFPINVENWTEKIKDWFLNYGINELILFELLDMSELKKINNLKICRIHKSDSWTGYGYFDEIKGLSESGMNYINCLKSLDKKIELFNVTNLQKVNNSKNEFRILDGRINFLFFNGDHYKKFFTELNLRTGFNGKNIGFWYWELEKINDKFIEGEQYLDALIVSSKFNESLFKSNFNKKIATIPIPFKKNLDYSKKKLIQEPYFITIFDFLSDFDRKNPIGSIEAFIQAFKNDQGPKLLIKTINANKDLSNYKKLFKKVGRRTDVIILDSKISSPEVNGLIKHSIGLISLHRSEGFGMNLVKAMKAGVPVICTSYSGNVDFCNSDTAFLIDFKFISTRLSNGFYSNFDSKWADPDIKQTSFTLQEIYFNYKKLYNKLVYAKTFINEYTSPNIISSKIADFINEISY